MLINARRFDTAESVTLHLDGDRIARLEPHAAGSARPLPWIAPGLIDVQVNGYGGQEFADAELTVDGVEQIGLRLDPGGVTQYCPTVTTHHQPVLLHAMQTLGAACEQRPAVACRVAGIHLEGPYLSAEDGPRGAHPLAAIRPPDWDEFQQLQAASGGRIVILTLSPEYEQAPAFIRRVVESGVVVAIGHTSATGDQIRAAVDAGATLSTHLGNGSHRLLPRHHNYVFEQLADDRLTASLIVDGHHLPPALVKTFVRAKTPARALLVSDVMGLAGLPAGEYLGTSLGDVEILPTGRVVVAGQHELLAGASLPMSVGIPNVMRYAGVDLKTATDMCTTQPAELLGLPRPTLQAGGAANLVLFELPGADGAGELGELKVTATINGGAIVFGSIE